MISSLTKHFWIASSYPYFSLYSLPLSALPSVALFFFSFALSPLAFSVSFTSSFFHHPLVTSASRPPRQALMSPTFHYHGDKEQLWSFLTSERLLCPAATAYSHTNPSAARMTYCRFAELAFDYIVFGFLEAPFALKWPLVSASEDH